MELEETACRLGPDTSAMDNLGCFHPLLQLSASGFPFPRQSEEHTHPPVCETLLRRTCASKQ